MPEKPTDPRPEGAQSIPTGPAITGAALASALDRLNDLVETRLVPALERIAASLERAPAPAPGVADGLGPRAEAVARVRLALDETRWEEAEAALEPLERDFPGAPEVGDLRARLDQGRARSIGELRDRLEASRKVNDPESVIALHDDLTVLLRGEARRELDQDVVRWLIVLIQRRMRAGTVQPDVVELAGRVADRFGTTPEGASVRASLPTLRRSAGLCPRCGAPYAGLDDACPRCLAVSATGDAEAPPAPPNPWADVEDDPDTSEDAGSRDPFDLTE